MMRICLKVIYWIFCRNDTASEKELCDGYNRGDFWLSQVGLLGKSRI